MDESTNHIMKFFSYEHLPVRLQEVSKRYAELADFTSKLPYKPERDVALRKLLEAKDAAVRSALFDV